MLGALFHSVVQEPGRHQHVAHQQVHGFLKGMTGFQMPFHKPLVIPDGLRRHGPTERARQHPAQDPVHSSLHGLPARRSPTQC